MTEIKSLLEKAGFLAKGAAPADAWSKMQEWAQKENNPFAMKAAVFRFLEIHGTKPEAASIIPEVLHRASAMHFEKVEKKTLIGLSEKAFRALESNMQREHMLPVSNNRPEPLLFLNPHQERKMDIYSPVKMSRDVNHLINARDTIFNVNEAVIKKVKPNGK
jgi:hypothetical protein